MTEMFRFPALAALLAAALLAGQASAQQPLPQGIVAAKGELSADERKQVADFVKAAADRFADAEPAEVTSMRGRMIPVRIDFGTWLAWSWSSSPTSGTSITSRSSEPEVMQLP